jgi:pyruvate,water dikinase
LSPAKRVVVRLLARHARRHIWWREQMRFARGQVFGVARRIFTALGEQLAARGGLEHAADVHYLDVHELRGAVRGTACSASGAALRDLVAQRRAAFDAFRAAPPPPRRFETAGPVCLAVPTTLASAAAPAPHAAEAAPEPLADRLRGTGASSGRVSAPAIVVHDPRRAGAVSGKIVVALATDPGWLPVFLSAAGIVVERGGLLSHSAIVARELGLPAVVGLRDATRHVRTGQRLEIDGATGEVWLTPV